tara:strand:- start:110 stop:526 length:417 start_codon:yes stop_codon:yes gene_type:complete
MAKKIMLKESELISMIERLVKEEAMTDQGGSGVMDPLEKEQSWGKLRQFLKDMYTNYKSEFADVQPNEFNEIQMVIKAAISLAQEKNINNKGATVISQYLKQHVRPLEKDAEQQTKEAPKDPELKMSDIKESFRRRLR